MTGKSRVSSSKQNRGCELSSCRGSCGRRAWPALPERWGEGLPGSGGGGALLGDAETPGRLGGVAMEGRHMCAGEMVAVLFGPAGREVTCPI